MSVSPATKLKVWVRCGGRCAICNRYLLDDGLIGKEVTVGELAHIVAQSQGKTAPRGDEDLDPALRDDAENLVLVCPNEHDAFDRPQLTGVISREVLLDIKQSHEERIKHLTGLGQERNTAVVRLVGTVRDAAVTVSRDDVAIAVVQGATRFPHYPMTDGSQGIEIDIRQVPGEKDAGPDYYRAVMARIDEVLDRQFYPAVNSGTIGHHVSLFGFARIPALMYLGFKLDDTLDADIYDKHRDAGWAWPESEQTVLFDTRVIDESAAAGPVNVVINVSGSIGPDEIPDACRGNRTFVIEPVGVAPRLGLIASPKDLLAFRLAVTQVFGAIEEHFAQGAEKTSAAINLFAAVPCSASVALGRAVARASHPPVAVWERGTGDGRFEHVLTINPRTPNPS